MPDTVRTPDGAQSARLATGCRPQVGDFHEDERGATVRVNEKGDRRRGTLSYLGPQKRPEFDGPVEAAEQAVPPGSDKDLPRGGRRLWMFDPRNHLPAHSNRPSTLDS